MIGGITMANMSTAGAYIADVTPPEQRAAKFGMLGAAWGIGFVLRPLLAAYSARWTRACRSDCRWHCADQCGLRLFRVA